MNSLNQIPQNPYASLSLNLRPALLSTVVLSALLVGCDSDSSSAEADDPQLDSAGRLVVYNQDTASLNVMEADSKALVGDYALSGDEPRLYAGPNDRHAVVIQRSDNRVAFLDSGFYVEDHEDHLHGYVKAPSMQDFTLSGTRPTHYTAQDGVGAVFFDAQEGLTASISLFSESSILQNQTVAELNLSNNMHGVARLVNDQLFTTYRDPLITDTTLPAAIERYRLDNGVLTLEQRYNEACPRLHGSATTANFIAFGCDALMQLASRVQP